MNFDRVLINLAIIKTNWDEDQSSILDNFMPIIGCAIQQLPDQEISEIELKQKVEEFSGFKIPGGALSVLIRRASKERYGYVMREHGLFLKNNATLSKIDFESRRRLAETSISEIKSRFTSFCKERFKLVDQGIRFEDAFIDVLSDIAPALVNSLSNNDALTHNKYNKDTMNYYVSSFIINSREKDNELFEKIVNISKGAIIAELLHYTDENMSKKKMNNVKIFFDTKLLLQILGYAETYEVTSSKELIKMLGDMNGKFRLFNHTFDELHGIFFAASRAAMKGWKIIYRPGDAFDILCRRGCTSSDIELIISTLDKQLEKYNILREDAQKIDETIHIDVNKLDELIKESIPNQTKKSRDHDTRALSAINQLRDGEPKRYFESCDAIFVTPNSSLASASTHFFNEEIGISHAPVCMPSHVFTMLMWLKTVNKKPDLPTEILLANSLAALDPSSLLWDRYISEAKRLKDSGAITEDDFHLLARELEAKAVLMDITRGDAETITDGTVKDVLVTTQPGWITDFPAMVAWIAWKADRPCRFPVLRTERTLA